MKKKRHPSLKTEHSGAKHGNGSYWGRKKDAKSLSNTKRRKDAEVDIEEQLDERTMEPSPGTILDDAGWYGLPGQLCFQDENGQTWVGHPGEWRKLVIKRV